MKVSLTVLLSLSLLALPALASDTTITAEDNNIGIRSGADFTYSNITGQYDNDGKQSENKNGSATSALININVEYNLANWVDGLSVGFDLPVIQNTANADGDVKTALQAADMATNWSGTGVGDVSAYGYYMYGVNDNVNVGGQVRFKAATGAGAEWNTTGERTAVEIGSGHHNVQASVLFNADVIDNMGIDFDAGYIATMEADQANVNETTKVNPGDIVYGNFGIAYTISNMITPEIGVHYYNATENTVAGATAANTDSNALGLSFNVGMKINNTWNANVGVGSNMISQGVNLPYGYTVMGKNANTGMGFNLGIAGAF